MPVTTIADRHSHTHRERERERERKRERERERDREREISDILIALYLMFTTLPLYQHV